MMEDRLLFQSRKTSLKVVQYTEAYVMSLPSKMSSEKHFTTAVHW